MIKCKEECYQEHYLWEKKVNRQYKDLNMSSNNRIKVDVRPSNLPTVIIDHLPEMTFLSVLCNFGGLVGMWLGVSVLATIKNLIDISKTLFQRINLTQFTFNINYNINGNNKVTLNEQDHYTKITNRRMFLINRFPYTSSSINKIGR